tara:strand:- start:195 stop:602 length:408 start_codon:yes stop_codon:yes gene_type:complete
MRRTASEIIRNLERRVARLEKQSRRNLNLSDLAEVIAKVIGGTYEVNLTSLSGDLEMGLHDFFTSQRFDEFYDDDPMWEHADNGIYDLVFDVKKTNSELKYHNTIFMSVVVHYFGGSKEVDFRVVEHRGRYKIKP